MPELDRHRASCDGPREPRGGPRLDSYEGLVPGGDSGPALVAGNARARRLIAKVEHRDRPFMPPRKRLPKATIARLRAWIAAGAAP
jgi:hypothetical protein